MKLINILKEIKIRNTNKPLEVVFKFPEIAYNEGDIISLSIPSENIEIDGEIFEDVIEFYIEPDAKMVKDLNTIIKCLKILGVPYQQDFNSEFLGLNIHISDIPQYLIK